MRKLKIGYWPLSQNLDSAGDRRRLVFWARARGHTVVTDLSQKVDVIVASENSDFNSLYFTDKRIPVIFDLVDAYLSSQSAYDDLARGIAKKLSGQISGGIKPFSSHVRDFCANAAAVICSSIEQESVIERYNANTHVVLDSHDEIPFIEPVLPEARKSNKLRILWEGQPATIRGIRQISSVLTQIAETHDLHFDLVTDEKYFQFLNRYIERDTKRLLQNDLRPIIDLIQVVPWSPTKLTQFAQKACVAMIPIDLSVPMQRLKPENRLLMMWRLGLPCLTSASPAYTRVALKAGVGVVCRSLQDWAENFNLLLNAPDFAYTEIAKGQNYLRENHNKTILLDKWDLVFESVLE